MAAVALNGIRGSSPLLRLFIEGGALTKSNNAAKVDKQVQLNKGFSRGIPANAQDTYGLARHNG